MIFCCAGVRPFQTDFEISNGSNMNQMALLRAEVTVFAYSRKREPSSDVLEASAASRTPVAIALLISLDGTFVTRHHPQLWTTRSISLLPPRTFMTFASSGETTAVLRLAMAPACQNPGQDLDAFFIENFFEFHADRRALPAHPLFIARHQCGHQRDVHFGNFGAPRRPTATPTGRACPCAAHRTG